MAGLAMLVLVFTAGATAQAAPPTGLESYDAGANGSAFDLQVGLLDLQIAAGLTSAEVTSQGPAAAGDGVGLLLAGTEQSGAHSLAPEGPESAESCAAEVVLPAPLDLTDGSCIAGVSSTAVLTDGAPSATGESDSLTLSLGGAELTEQLLNALPLEDVLAPLGDVLGQLNDVTCQLNGVTGPLLAQLGSALSGLGLDLNQDTLDILCSLDELPSIVDALLDSLGDALATTVTITVAPNSSAASADDAQGVIASAVAEGATIDVLPGLGPDGSSFIEIIVGASEASVVRDPITGVATPVVTPAVAQVNVNGIGLAGLDLGLGNLTDPILDLVNDLVNTLATSSPLSCGETGPLSDILCLDAALGYELDAAEAAAAGYDYGEGTVGARTSALRLELLSILNGGEPALSLSLAEAVAAANAIPGQDVPPSTETPETTEPTLPLTGGTSGIALFGALGLGIAALVVRSRRGLTAD